MFPAGQIGISLGESKAEITGWEEADLLELLNVRGTMKRDDVSVEVPAGQRRRPPMGFLGGIQRSDYL